MWEIAGAELEIYNTPYAPYLDLGQGSALLQGHVPVIYADNNYNGDLLGYYLNLGYGQLEFTGKMIPVIDGDILDTLCILKNSNPTTSFLELLFYCVAYPTHYGFSASSLGSLRNFQESFGIFTRISDTSVTITLETGFFLWFYNYMQSHSSIYHISSTGTFSGTFTLSPSYSTQTASTSLHAQITHTLASLPFPSAYIQTHMGELLAHGTPHLTSGSANPFYTLLHYSPSSV